MLPYFNNYGIFFLPDTFNEISFNPMLNLQKKLLQESLLCDSNHFLQH